MSLKLFSDTEIEELSKNPNVRNVTSKGITYTDEFKRIFISENENGKLPRQIFEDHGFDIDIIGMERVKSSGKRWRTMYRNEGAYGLVDSRKENSGRSSEKELSIEEKYERFFLKNLIPY